MFIDLQLAREVVGISMQIFAIQYRLSEYLHIGATLCNCFYTSIMVTGGDLQLNSTAKNERFPKFASTGNLTGNLMFQGVRYLRMCIIPITFPEKTRKCLWKCTGMLPIPVFLFYLKYQIFT